MRKIDDDGVTFRSHIDGRTHRFTPEKVMEIEQNLGADIAMVLDECSVPDDYDYLKRQACRERMPGPSVQSGAHRADQALFGIVQKCGLSRSAPGQCRGADPARLPGYAIGGLSVGESKADMHVALDATTPALPEDKPRYLMGVGIAGGPGGGRGTGHRYL